MGQWQAPNILRDEVGNVEIQQCHNSPIDLLTRAAGFHLETIVTLDANNDSDVKNIFVFEKTVRVFALHLEIVDATVLNNCTGLYFDAWDGAVAEILTLDGAVLSGFEVDSFALKDQDDSAVLTVARADQVRMIEPATGKKSHQPFTVTAKSGQSDFIRLHYSTTDTPINAQLKIIAEYAVINGGKMDTV